MRFKTNIFRGNERIDYVWGYFGIPHIGTVLYKISSQYLPVFRNYFGGFIAFWVFNRTERGDLPK
ncbi:hypothetical protein D9M68_559350 [compost metagenome]